MSITKEKTLNETGSEDLFYYLIYYFCRLRTPTPRKQCSIVCKDTLKSRRLRDPRGNTEGLPVVWEGGKGRKETQYICKLMQERGLAQSAMTMSYRRKGSA